MRVFAWSFLLFPLVMISAVSWTVFDIVRGPRMVENAAPQDVPFDLPTDATDVCYMTRPPTWPNTQFEFSVQEGSFRAWAERRGYQVQEIVEPVVISRCTGLAHISSGLYYTRMSGPDSGQHVAYDRQLARAYYHSHTR